LYAGRNPNAFFGKLRELGYKLKGVGMPSYHLGGDFKRVSEPESVLTWGSVTYVKRLLELYAREMENPVPTSKIHAPLDPKDYPELDDSPLMDAEGTRKYQSLVGGLQWLVSLGRNFELSSHSCCSSCWVHSFRFYEG